MSEVIAVTNSMLSVDALKRIVTSSYDLGNILEVRFLHFGLNDTYLVRTQKLEKFILRVYRHGWRSGSDVAYELDVLIHLRQKGVSVSVPIPQNDGQLMRELLPPEGVRFMVLFSFAPGQTINYDEFQSSAYGRAVAQTHNAMQDFSSPHQRFELDLEHLLETPLRIIRSFLEHQSDDDELVMAGLIRWFEHRSVRAQVGSSTGRFEHRSVRAQIGLGQTCARGVWISL
jgi:Ser/Thr protein kinase RdoA (MazF antagonist)